MSQGILTKATQPHRDKADDVRAEVWEETLIRADANLREAGEEHGFSRQRAWTLTQRHGLQGLAEQLREDRRTSKKGRQ
jgi:hypothetical protein